MSFVSPHLQPLSIPRHIALALVAMTHLGCFQDPPTNMCPTASCDADSTMTSGGSSAETQASNTSGVDDSSSGTGGVTSTSDASVSGSGGTEGTEGETSAASSGNTGDTAVDTDDGGASESGGAEGSGGDTSGGTSSSYGDPAMGCLPNEVPAVVPGASGQICSPACGRAGECPPLDPPGPAIPQCALVMDGGSEGTHCVLVCDLFAAGPQCPPGSTCKDVGQGQAGACTYP